MYITNHGRGGVSLRDRVCKISIRIFHSVDTSIKWFKNRYKKFSKSRRVFSGLFKNVISGNPSD